MKRATGEPWFKKILVANRGEIACRIITTCQRLGIRTVAVHSDVDADSRHVRLADEHVPLLPSSPTDNLPGYLNVEAIIQACRQTGAEAVHPGYGFLSENAQFCQRLQDQGIVFIGPPERAMRDLGDKLASKKIARQAGVPTVPGHDAAVPDAATAVRIVRDVLGGYPVMVKASAGGGGKGMRVAWCDDDLTALWPLAKSEARNAFGDDRLLVERFIEAPRHIEVQILADTQGTVLHLPERDCSIQRRNQKVIEEAPSPALTGQQRLRMGQCAARLAASVNYASVGTVEFLYDNQSGDFYFLEMNTRLQVEHPITELITGLDLVEQMIRVAAGLPLTVTQRIVDAFQGWAVEARLYAEDPMTDYLPSIGQLTRYREPPSAIHFSLPSPQHQKNGQSRNRDVKANNDQRSRLQRSQAKDLETTGVVRCDSGIEEGSRITVHYDPMICKLCAWGPDRPAALDRLTLALDELVVQGVVHNKNLLREVLTERTFHDEPTKVTTKYLPETFPEGFHGHQLTPLEQQHLAGMCVFMHAELRKQGFQPTTIEDSLRFNDPDAYRDFWVSVDGERTFFRISLTGIHEFTTMLNEEQGQWQVMMQPWQPYDPIMRFQFANGQQMIMQLEERMAEGRYRVSFLGTGYECTVRTDLEHHLSQYQPKQKVRERRASQVPSPMPGLVVKLAVKEGETVSKGQELCVIEAMKMQNVLKSDRQAIVRRVCIAQGDTVSTGQVLIEFQE